MLHWIADHHETATKLHGQIIMLTLTHLPHNILQSIPLAIYTELYDKTAM